MPDSSAAASGMATPTCFICEDDASTERLLQVCACKSRWLHLSCQRKLIASTVSSQPFRCAVCAENYSNLTVKASWRVRRDFEACFVPHCSVGL